MARYKAFISYKHVTSIRFAENLEMAIKAYAKPIYRAPIAVFRDEKFLRPGIDLPSLIRHALDRSEFLIFLASPQAVESEWVRDELVHWCREHGRRQRLIIVLTEGKIVADSETKRIDWTQTDALPDSLADVLQLVPLYVDLSWARSDEQQTLLNPDYKKAINSIVATLRGIDPIELSGQEILQHRANIRIRNTFVSAIGSLSVLLLAAAWFAWDQMLEAEARAREATSRRLAAEADRLAEGRIDTALLLMAQAYRMGDHTTLRGSWWRLLGSSTLPDAYLPVPASEAQFHPDGELELRGGAGSAWFALDGDRWTRTRRPSNDATVPDIAGPGWEWAGGCEEIDCAQDDIWECAESIVRPIGPYGDSMEYCRNSRVRVPDWCGDAVIETPGFEVSLQRRGLWLEVETNAGRARYACVELPQALGAGGEASSGPRLIAGTPAFFPENQLDRFSQGGAEIRWLTRSFDGRWYAVIRHEGYPELRRSAEERVPSVHPGVTVLNINQPVKAIATSGEGAIAVAIAPPQTGSRGEILLWRDPRSARNGPVPDLVIAKAWRTRGSLGGALAFSHRGTRLVAGADVDVSVYDAGSGSELHNIWIGRQVALDVAISHDDALLAVATRPLDGALDPPPQVFGLGRGPQGVPLGKFAAPTIEFDPEHADAVLLAGERGIHLHSLGGEEGSRVLAEASAELLAIDPDRRLFAASLADQSLLIRGLDDPTQTYRSGRRASPARGLVFTGDGDFILRASAKSLEAWDWQTNTWWNIALTAHEDLAALPDNAILALENEQAIIYDLLPAHWLALTCDIVRRNLSLEEWRAQIGEGFAYECACPTYPAGEGLPANRCERVDL